MRAARKGLAALLAVMAVTPAQNDVCPLALSGLRCSGTTGCEQCSGEMFDSIAALHADPEGQALVAERAAADVAHQLAHEPDGAA